MTHIDFGPLGPMAMKHITLYRNPPRTDGMIPFIVTGRSGRYGLMAPSVVREYLGDADSGMVPCGGSSGALTRFQMTTCSPVHTKQIHAQITASEPKRMGLR